MIIEAMTEMCAGLQDALNERGRQVETLQAWQVDAQRLFREAQASFEETKAELKHVTEQLADANTASDLNCHGWKECQAELSRVTAERDAKRDQLDRLHNHYNKDTHRLAVELRVSEGLVEHWRNSSNTYEKQALARGCDSHRLGAELAEANHWRKRWCDDYHAAAQQAQATFDERKHLKAELARMTAERDNLYARETNALTDKQARDAELTTLREQLAAARDEIDQGIKGYREHLESRLATLETAAREARDWLLQECYVTALDALEQQLTLEHGFKNRYEFEVDVLRRRLATLEIAARSVVTEARNYLAGTSSDIVLFDLIPQLEHALERENGR